MKPLRPTTKKTWLLVALLAATTASGLALSYSHNQKISRFLVPVANTGNASLNASGLAPSADGGSTQLYLHGTGSNDNPSSLFLNATAPAGTTAKFKDSPGVNFNGGNQWKQIGTWSAAAANTPQDLTALGPFRTWLGLKNSDDQGTQFDLRAEVYKNAELVASAQSLCITGITRNPNHAKEATLQFGAIPKVTVSSGDVLSLKILARIGTTAQGTKCTGPGGSHNNAVGLRLYFDSASRPSSLYIALSPWNQYSEPSLGFSFQYPDFPKPTRISVDQSDANATLIDVELFDDTNGTFISVFGITIRSNPAGVGLQQWFAQTLDTNGILTASQTFQLRQLENGVNGMCQRV